jgi:hypothetical protein
MADRVSEGTVLWYGRAHHLFPLPESCSKTDKSNFTAVGRQHKGRRRNASHIAGGESCRNPKTAESLEPGRRRVAAPRRLRLPVHPVAV